MQQQKKSNFKQTGSRNRRRLILFAVSILIITAIAIYFSPILEGTNNDLSMTQNAVEKTSVASTTDIKVPKTNGYLLSKQIKVPATFAEGSSSFEQVDHQLIDEIVAYMQENPKHLAAHYTEEERKKIRRIEVTLYDPKVLTISN